MRGRIWFILNTFTSVVYLVWRIFFTIPFGFGIISVSAGIILLVLEGLGMVEAFIHFMNMRSASEYKKPEVPLERFPHVDIFIATYSEEPELLYKTINGCKRIEYPDKNKIHIYLCDDNRRPEMEELARKMGINYLKRATNEGAKAGNLNNAMKFSSSPYIVTLDADMIPQRRFLMELVPYLVDAEMKNEGKSENQKVKLGFIQSPQNFYNPDLFQFNLFSEGRIPNEQDYFYKDIQVARTKTNSVIYGGSNTIISREALDAVGGFSMDGITEDFSTGIRIQKAGYVSLGTSDPLASGLSPTDLPNLIQQRIRWARGVIYTGKKEHILTTKDLSFGQKMNYWASVYYWYAPLKRLVYVMSPLLYATFGFTIFKCTLPEVLVFWLPMYITTNMSLRMLSGNIRSSKWTGIYETIMFPFMLIPVMLETFGISLKKFKVTEKSTPHGKPRHDLYMVPFLLLIFLSVIGIFRCVLIIFDSMSFGPIVVIFWMVLNLYYLIMAMLFIDGRVAYRKTERVPLTVPCTVVIDDFEAEGETVDVSEEGFAVAFGAPYSIDENSIVTMTMKWDIYSAFLKARVVYVKQRDDRWMYSFIITDYLDSYDEWLQIVHDRIPPLPSVLKKNSGSFDDLKINTMKRLETPFFQKRKYPRILLDDKTKYVCEGREYDVILIDFNYAYASLDLIGGPERIELSITDGVVLNLRFHKNGKAQNSLYEIMNIHEIIRDRLMYRKLLEYLELRNSIARDDSKKARHEMERKSRESAKKKTVVFDETNLLK